MYKNFNDWDTYEGFFEGSGTSDQRWIVNKELNKIGLFKFPKSTETTDHISEKIASDVAKLIGLECAEVELGIYENRNGMISYKINSSDEELIEGIRIISSKYKNYDSDELMDINTGECYSLTMVMNSLKEYQLENEFLKIAIFDFLIGNSDRHDRNWAILRRDKLTKLCPIYDNASSLCSYVNEDSLEEFFGDDNRFRALVDSKSRSLIRIDKYTLGRRGPKHSEVVEYIKNNYFNCTIEFVTLIKDILTEETINTVIDRYKECLTYNKVRLLKKYLIAKVSLLLHIYNI